MSYLGLDCGTSALKASLVDEDGAIIAISERPYRPDRPHPRWSEQNPEVWRDAMFEALRDLRAKAAKALASLRGVGFSGQMHSAVILGADDRPIRPAMLHNDTRAHVEARELQEKHPDLARVVGVKPMAGFTAPKLMWLARHEAGVRARIAKVMLPKDYLRLALTGETACDMSDAAGTWWLDESRREWCAPALAASGVEPSLLPHLVEACQAAGSIRPEIASEFGLPRSVVVAAGAGDAAAGAVGLGAIRPGEAYISLGTATQLIVASDVYRAAPELMVHSFAHALPGRWYRMAAMLTGAAALAFAARLVKGEIAELEREASQDYRGPGELIFLPYLSGERTPHDDPNARGVLFGLSEASTRADMTRAVMEGVAFSLADARECLEAAGDRIGRVGLIGGGARSALWTQMIAAALDREIVRYRGGEAGPGYGAARLARIAATGEAPDRVCKTPEILDVTKPEPRGVEAFARRRPSFQNLYRALKGEFATA